MSRCFPCARSFPVPPVRTPTAPMRHQGRRALPLAGGSRFSGLHRQILNTVLLGLGLFLPALRAATVPELLKERLPCVVAIEFVVQTETDRRPNTVLGTVIDDQGTVVLPGSAISPGLANDQVRNVKAFTPGSGEEYSAEYLGQDAYTGWHYVRVEPRLRPLLVPIARFAPPGTPAPRLDDEVWGIGLRNREEDFMPYVLSSRLALISRLPNETAIAAQEVAGPGLPVFDRSGRFIGLAQNSFGQNFLMFSRGQNGAPVLLVNVEESSVVLLASEVLPNLSRIPARPDGRPIAWIGIYGLQPVDPEVGKLLRLEMQSGVVVSDFFEGGPAARTSWHLTVGLKATRPSAKLGKFARFGTNVVGLATVRRKRGRKRSSLPDLAPLSRRGRWARSPVFSASSYSIHVPGLKATR